MKTLGLATQQLVAQRLGTEPVTIVAVQWVVDGNWYLYADEDIGTEVNGDILEISTLESVVKIDNNSVSQSISLKLNDIEDKLKWMIDNHDIHGRVVRVYQWFDTLPLTEKFLLYEGEINSPIVWSEGDRTLSFSVITQLTDKEAGYSPEEGDYDYLPDNMIGVAWPLSFGTNQNVPCIALEVIPSTIIAHDIGAVDPSIDVQLAEISHKRQEYQNIWWAYMYAYLQAVHTCDYGETEELRNSGCQTAEYLSGALTSIADTIAQMDTDSYNLLTQKRQQEIEQQNTIAIINGSGFPENTSVTVRVGNLTLNGYMTGNTLSIQDREVDEFKHYVLDAEPFGYTYIPAGTRATLQTNDAIQYIANILPCTIHTVQARRRLNNADVLTIVPSEWYTVGTANIGSYTVTTINFDMPLSSHDETFQDDIYVTLTSTVGPNTVDILIWLIETYTDLEYDATSFNAVKAKLENYPSHFTLLDRRNIVTLLEEIAFQARCAIWISQRKFYIKYLAEEAASTDTITETDVDAGTLEIYMTTTEEIVTKLVATWRDDYASDNYNKIVLRHNVKKYGTREREIEFYIYNMPDLVLKSATFWLVRLSNVWKNVKFTTYMHKITIDTYDTITLDFAQDFVASADVKAVITSNTYDSDAQSIVMEAWTPVKIGTMTAYDFAWPSQIDDTLEFPTYTEKAVGYAGGAGPGVNTSGSTLTLSGTVPGVYHASRDHGDRYPSDINDVKPVPTFVGTEFTPGSEPVYTYAFKPYTLVLGTPPSQVTAEPEATVYPGIVDAVADADYNNYYVNVYLKGFALGGEAPTRLIVHQLQLATDEVIPTGTWVVVGRVKLGLDAFGNQLQGENGDGYNYFMQTPVWL